MSHAISISTLTKPLTFSHIMSVYEETEHDDIVFTGIQCADDDTQMIPRKHITTFHSNVYFLQYVYLHVFLEPDKACGHSKWYYECDEFIRWFSPLFDRRRVTEEDIGGSEIIPKECEETTPINDLDCDIDKSLLLNQKIHRCREQMIHAPHASVRSMIYLFELFQSLQAFTRVKAGTFDRLEDYLNIEYIQFAKHKYKLLEKCKTREDIEDHCVHIFHEDGGMEPDDIPLPMVFINPEKMRLLSQNQSLSSTLREFGAYASRYGQGSVHPFSYWKPHCELDGVSCYRTEALAMKRE